jgi:hypothetical protein
LQLDDAVVIRNDDIDYACIFPNIDNLPSTAFQSDNVVSLVPTSFLDRHNRAYDIITQASTLKFPTQKIFNVFSPVKIYYPQFGVPSFILIKILIYLFFFF